MSTVRISNEDKDVLNRLCEKTNMAQGVVLGYLLECAIKFDMFDQNWIRKLTDADFLDRMQEHDIEYRKKVELEKFKTILNTKQKLIQEYLKIMPNAEKKAYIESALALGDGENLLDNLTSYQMFVINGEKKMLPPDGTGAPRIPGVAPSQLKQCPQGWHTVHDNCLSCRVRRGCELRREERINWVAVHGTKEEQERLIDGRDEV